MEPMQVALSENLRSHEAVQVCFQDVRWNPPHRETSLRKASPFTLLPEQIHSFLCALCVPGAARGEMNTELTGRERRTCEQAPSTTPPQGQQ